MSAAMAETALWAVLSLQRGFFDYARAAARGRVAAARRNAAPTRCAVLVLGLGADGPRGGARWRRRAIA